MKIESNLNDETLNKIAERAADILEQRSLNKGNDEDKFYTVSQVAKMLHLKEWTIRNHIDLGLLVASKPGKSFLISQEQLDNYINQNKSK